MSEEIRSGLNGVIESVIRCYRDGRIELSTAQYMIVSSLRAMRQCKGEPDKDIESLHDICGCCLKKAQPGKSMYNVFGTCPEVPYETVLSLKEGNGDSEYMTCQDFVCSECFDRIFNHIIGKSGAGAELRNRLKPEQTRQF